MTVPATARRAGPYSGNGSTTSFSFSFKTFAAGDLEVTKTSATGIESVLVLNSDYSVTLNGDQDASPGGSITYPISGSALASGEKLTIVGDLAYEQTTDLLGGGAFNARVIEDTFDRTVVQIQQLEERTDRTLVLPVSASGVSSTLPTPASDKIIGWNSTATGFVNRDITDLATAVSYANWRTDTFNGNGSTTQFTLAADPGNVNNLDIAIGGVVQTASTDYTVSGTTLTFTSAPPSGTANVVVRYGQALPVGTANASQVTFDPAGTGATSRTVQSKLRDTVSVKDFGAVGDGVTDDTAAIQAAIDSLGVKGGTVILPVGKYRTTATLTISTLGVRLIGQGTAGIITGTAGSAGVVGTGNTNNIATEIYADFTSGPVIRVRQEDCALENFAVSASTSRNQAARSTNYGVWVEAEDLPGYYSTGRFYAFKVQVVNQPSDGFVFVNGTNRSRIDFCSVRYCKGHGIVIVGGHYTGRTNKANPGQFEVWNCETHDLGGHGVMVGGPLAEASAADICYRVHVKNLEAYYCCYTPAICANPATPSTTFMAGENITYEGSASDGRRRYPSVVDDHTALEVRGRHIDIINNRFIDGNPYAIKIVGHALMSSVTRSVNIINPYISNVFQGAGYYNPAIYYSTDALGVNVQSDAAFSGVNTLSSKAAGTWYTEQFNGVKRSDVPQPELRFSGSTANEISLADDRAGYVDLGTPGARGVFHLGGNLAGAGHCIFAFRCGDANAHVTVLSSGGVTVGAGTGTLAGTTGADGQLNIRADTATNRIYIENRTGASRGYQYTITPLSSGATPATFVTV